MVPSNGLLLIEASGRERDSTSDEASNDYVKLVEEINSKISEYIKDKYNLPESRLGLGYAAEIAEAFKRTDITVDSIAGQAGQTTSELTAIFGADSVPGWGYIALSAAYSVHRLSGFLSDVNPDDGIGIIKEICSARNNFCLGEHIFASKFNGNDQDSEGDYDMFVAVEEVLP